MGLKLLCSIDGCGNPRKARGWCGAHWYRWRQHGSPTGGRTPNGEALRYLNEVVLEYEGNECLPWPYIRDANGYGKVHIDDKLHLVSRVVCEKVNGPPPTPDHEAAHGCGNGDEACCTKRHLFWKTHAQNAADMIAHGTSPRGERNGQADITREQVSAIRALEGSLSHHVIGARFGISRQHVGDILRKRRWGWLQ